MSKRVIIITEEGKFEYTELLWYLAWFLVFIFGLITAWVIS